MKKVLPILLSMLLVTALVCGALADVPGDAGFAVSAGEGDIAIDAVSFPDPALRAYIESNIDVSGDGILTQEERENVTFLYIDEKGIADLKGAEWFPNLEQLICRDNAIEHIDVSMLASLRELWCGGNRLTSLDVSGMTKLNSLNVDGNPLKTLNASGCTALEDLLLQWATVERLDLTGCTALKTLNVCENMTALDVSGCTALEELDVTNSGLTNLKLTGCSGLKTLNCAGNRLTALDVTDCPKLESLDCHGNGIASVDLSKCEKLQASAAAESGDANEYITMQAGGGSLTLDKSTALVVDGKTVHEAEPTAIRPKKVSGLKLQAGKRALTVRWKAREDVDGYQVQYATKRSFSGAKKKTVKKASTKKLTLKKLKSRKTYYVRIRAYKTVNGTKLYSAWSKAVKKKTK